MLCYVIIFGIVATLSVDRYIYNDSIMESIEIGDDMAKHRNTRGEGVCVEGIWCLLYNERLNRWECLNFKINVSPSRETPQPIPYYVMLFPLYYT